MNDEIKLKHLANRQLDLYINGTPDDKLGKVLNRHIDEDSFFYSSPFADFSDFLMESELGDRELLEEMWESIEESLVCMFDYEERVFREFGEVKGIDTPNESTLERSERLERVVYSVENIPCFDVSGLSHNLKKRNRFLEKIIELFNSNQPLLNLVVLSWPTMTPVRPGKKPLISLLIALSQVSLLSHALPQRADSAMMAISICSTRLLKRSVHLSGEKIPSPVICFHALFAKRMRYSSFFDNV